MQVDAEGLKVRPNHTRCTVILREISENTQGHEVEVIISTVIGHYVMLLPMLLIFRNCLTARIAPR